MINRRTFTALFAGTVAAPKRAWSQQVTAKTVFYASTGPELALFDVDVADAALQKRGTVTLPANIQYAWPHPSKRYLYRSEEYTSELQSLRHLVCRLLLEKKKKKTYYKYY